MKIVIILLLLISTGVGSDETPSIRAEVLEVLPTELSVLNSKTSQDEIRKKFGKKVRETDKDAVFISYFQKKNDLTIGLKEKRFQYFYLELSGPLRDKTKSLFSKAYQRLTAEQQQALLKPTEASHESGRYIDITIPEESLSLRFKNNEEKNLHSVLIWNPGEKRP